MGGGGVGARLHEDTIWLEQKGKSPNDQSVGGYSKGLTRSNLAGDYSP